MHFFQELWVIFFNGFTRMYHIYIHTHIYQIYVSCFIYMDDLSSALNDSIIGCSFNGVLFNHLMYAVDTCITAP